MKVKKQQNTLKAREEKNYRKYVTMLISSQLLLLWKMDGTMCNKNQALKNYRKYVTMLISSQLLLLWKMDGTMCNKNQALNIFWIPEVT